MLPKPSQVNPLRAAAVIACIGILGLAAPLLWSAVRAGASLLLLGLFVVLALGALQLLPYLGQRLERYMLAARLRDARQRPLEQLQAELIQRGEQLGRYRAALASIHAQIEGMRELLEERRKADPQHDVTKQEAALGQMVAFHERHLRKLDAAALALSQYHKHLAAKRFEWNFAQAGQHALEQLHADDRESIVRELLNDEATRAIQLDFHRVFAELDGELRLLTAAPP